MDLEERLRKMRQEQEKRMGETMDRVSGRMADHEKRLQAKWNETAGGGNTSTSSSAAPPRVPRFSERINMDRNPHLDRVDELMDRDFDLRRRLGTALLELPTTYCETPREYIEPLVAGMPLSDAQREAALAEIEEAIAAGHHVSLVESLGVHIPGVGSFINGWRLARESGQAPAAYLKTDEGLARTVTTASHEKCGHGFISELTPFGLEQQELQLGMHHLADSFEMRSVDTPEHARLSEQWSILFQSSVYTQEGYATWIERYLAQRMAALDDTYASLPQYAPHFELEAVADALRRADLNEAADILEVFFGTLGESPVEDTIGTWIKLVMMAQEASAAFPRACGMPASYVIGYLAMNYLAAMHGPKCLPYAVATACNVRYGLETMSNQDLRNYVGQHPNLNVDLRMVLLLVLPRTGDNDVDAFLAAARDSLGLAPPGG